jgi:hypothetical protein
MATARPSVESAAADNGDTSAGRGASRRSVPPLRRDAKRRVQADAPQGARLIAAFVFVAVMCMFAYGQVAGKRTIAGLVIVPIVCAAMLPWFNRIAKRTEGLAFDLVGILFLGLLLRFVGAFFRLRDAADAVTYHEVGIKLARSFTQFDFAPDTGRKIPGTGSVRYLSGLISVVTDTQMFAEFLVFTVIGFIGAIFFYLAFVTAFPEGDRRRYALLIFLWPSMFFWPSSIGKEAVMSFTIGLASLGAARLYMHKRAGILLLTLGLAGSLMVRPHIAFVLLIAVLIAYVFIGRSDGSVAIAFGKYGVILLMILAGGFIATRTADFLQLESFNADEVSGALQGTQDRTAQGGAEFTPMTADNPVRFPLAVGTVLFRPLPFEVHNTESAVTSIESLFLIALIIASLSRLRQLPRMIFRVPYLAYCVSAILLFCYIFSVIANFGLLARQRTQVLPFLFVLLAVPEFVREMRPPTVRTPIATVASRAK